MSKNKSLKKDFLSPKAYWFGLIFFSLVCLAVIIRDIFILQDYNFFFWYCDFISFFILIAVIIKSRDMLDGAINTGLFIQIAYLCSIIFALVFPNQAPIFTKEILSQTSLLIFFTILLHLIVLVAFILNLDSNVSKKSLIYSFIVGCLMFFPTLWFVPSNMNLNMIYAYSGLENIIPLYTPLWVFWFFVFIIIPTYFVRKGIYFLLNSFKK